MIGNWFEKCKCGKHTHASDHNCKYNNKDLMIEFLKEKSKTINVNDTILVKLNEAGYQHLADNHNKYHGFIPSWEKRDITFYENRADENGFTEFQLWHFMNEFGDKTYLGGDLLFDPEILIKNTDLGELDEK